MHRLSAVNHVDYGAPVEDDKGGTHAQKHGR